MNTDFFQLFTPVAQENEYLQELDGYYKTFSEMSQQEREFLNALILRHKPQRLLEIGVSSGASSVVMLNAIKNFGSAKLYSIDYCKKWYIYPKKNTGFVVEHYPQLKTEYNLYAGGMAYKFIEEISAEQKIDFAFIDAAHSLPGEILDVLMILPFLSDDAIIVFHDTNLQVIDKDNVWIVNNLLISSLVGRKIWQGNFNKYNKIYFPNIAGVQFTEQSKGHIFELLNLLTLKWKYLLPREEVLELTEFFSKYYPIYFIEYFRQICDFQELMFNRKYTTKLKNICRHLWNFK